MRTPKIENMTSPRTGTKVANQFVITEEGHGALGNFIKRETFQSYDSIIAVRTVWPYEAVKNMGGKTVEIVLDETYWNYSRTTSKYRSEFLGESTDETRRKIESGEYKLADLNK